MNVLKSDRPRPIDRVIDYFGEHRPPTASPPPPVKLGRDRGV